MKYLEVKGTHNHNVIINKEITIYTIILAPLKTLFKFHQFFLQCPLWKNKRLDHVLHNVIRFLHLFQSRCFSILLSFITLIVFDKYRSTILWKIHQFDFVLGFFCLMFSCDEIQVMHFMAQVR